MKKASEYSEAFLFL